MDEEARKVMMLASSTAETDIGAYANEYVLVVEMSQDRKEAEKVVEWVDSGYSVRFMGRLRHEVEMKKTKREGGSEKL